MGSPTKLISNSPKETFKIGQLIAYSIKTNPAWHLETQNIIIALSGELGSGKTCLSKGIAEGLGINEPVTSPTYTVINEYDHRIKINEYEYLKLYHIDVYRLNNDEDFINIGGQELLSSNGIFIIEWSDKIKRLLPENTIIVNIEITGYESRIFNIEGISI